MRLRLVWAGIPGRGTPCTALWISAWLLASPALLRLHTILLILRPTVALTVECIVSILRVMLLSVRIMRCVSAGTSRSSCGPAGTVVDVLIVVRLLRHLVRHVVHLNVVDVGHRTTLALAAAACTSTIDGFGAGLVDVVILLSKRQPLDLFRLLGALAEGEQDQPSKDDETGNTTNDTSDDSTQVGARAAA